MNLIIVAVAVVYLAFPLGHSHADCGLGPGDPMVLPPHTPHAATVGAGGVRCIQAPRHGEHR